MLADLCNLVQSIGDFFRTCTYCGHRERHHRTKQQGKAVTHGCSNCIGQVCRVVHG